MTVAGNTATAPVGGFFRASSPTGAGISATRSVALTNATISDNVLTASSTDGTRVPAGSAIHAAHATLEQSTIVGNAGGAALETPNLTTNRSAVLADPGVGICTANTAVAASAYNEFSDTSCRLRGATDRQGRGGYLLGPVADNGGPVGTVAPGAASVLVDAIPAASCPVPTDARGIARPQGGRCDIGAVELVPTTDTGPADLRVAFSSPPAAVVPGTDGTWTVTVANQGPASSRPTVAIAIPAGVSVTGATTTPGGCRISPASVTCGANNAMAAGTTTTVTLVGHVDASVIDPLRWQATVSAPGALAPLTDDTATLSTAVTPRADLRLALEIGRSEDDPGHEFSSVSITAHNAGPSTAVGTRSQPLLVSFVPVAGVHVVPIPPVAFIGTLAPGADLKGYAAFAADGASLPAVVGTASVGGGTTVDPDPSGQTVAVAGADLGVVARRPSGTQSPGAPIPFTITVTNHGLGVAHNTEVRLFTGVQKATYQPTLGSMGPHDPYLDHWLIPDLGPGASATLNGTVPANTTDDRFVARVMPNAVDVNNENDDATVDLRSAPGGTADLRVDPITVALGAPGQRILRSRIVNAGPVTSTAGAATRLEVTLPGVPDSSVVDATTTSPGWTCWHDQYWARCSSSQPLASGASVAIQFTVAGSYPAAQPRLGVEVDEALTVDPDRSNNQQFVDALRAT